MTEPDAIPTTTNPFLLFQQWYENAREKEADPADAMSLATCSLDGQPSVRMVLLKDHGNAGFVFYTNNKSRKADEIRQNPQAALCFHWKSLQRQVRIEGKLEIVDNREADRYFATRSRESCMSAWASEQSQILSSRAELLSRYKERVAQFEGQSVPRPPFWQGYRLAPEMIEFWLHLPHRLHDRVLFKKSNFGWERSRLFP